MKYTWIFSVRRDLFNFNSLKDKTYKIIGYFFDSRILQVIGLFSSHLLITRGLRWGSFSWCSKKLVSVSVGKMSILVCENVPFLGLTFFNSFFRISFMPDSLFGFENFFKWKRSWKRQRDNVLRLFAVHSILRARNGMSGDWINQQDKSKHLIINCDYQIFWMGMIWIFTSSLFRAACFNQFRFYIFVNCRLIKFKIKYLYL